MGVESGQHETSRKLAMVVPADGDQGRALDARCHLVLAALPPVRVHGAAARS